MKHAFDGFNKGWAMVAIFLILWALPVFQGVAKTTPGFRSSYAGEEKRAIKSLSAKDIADLKTGKGWGLAKAAELNGVPGPAHLLEMSRKIGLSETQVEKIESIYSRMREKVVRLGQLFIELERDLNGHFARGTITDGLLRDLLKKIAEVRMELRYTHLETHLRTPPLLTNHQIVLYRQMRGYTGKTDRARRAADDVPSHGGH